MSTGRATDQRVRLDALPTEAWNARSADLDLRGTVELVSLMSSEDASVPLAVERAGASIADAIDAIVSRLEAGGRLVYVGAGTSGRLALVDAVECESTFAVEPGLVVALVAGGATSAATAQEHAEDDDVAGVTEITDIGIGSLDAVVGLSASGRTPYVVGALAAARSAGALTVGLVAAPG